jgi:hypothetical protein
VMPEIAQTPKYNPQISQITQILLETKRCKW